MKKNKALILGAGPTGLITAWRLLESGWDVKIIEKEDTVGGLCRSWKHKNFIVDTGPHIFHTPDVKLKNFWKKHFGDLLIEGNFYGKNVQGKDFDKFFNYPLSFEDLNNFEPTIKSFVESFDNLFSIGAGGEFNYADSQILFHKSFDLVNSLINKNDNLLNETKNINYVKLNNKVKINNSFIGNNSGTFIVAEAGLNHNGSFELAKKLIDNAKASKCDAIKFQSFLENSRVSKTVKTEKYAEKIIGTQ